MSNNPAVTQSLITLAITALVVFRFAQRELKERVVKAGVTLWLRPAILAAVMAWLVVLTVTVDPAGVAEMIVAVVVGAALGAVTGRLIIANTAFAPADVPNAVRVRGSRVTFGIWLGVFAVRLLARYLIPHGADPRTQLPLNAGTVAVVVVAFVMIAVAFAREIRRAGGGPRA